MTGLPNVNLYYPAVGESNSRTQASYRVNISWTVDKHIREQLKVVQCVATFEGRTHPFRTSVLGVNFLDSEQEQGMPRMVSVLSEGCHIIIPWVKFPWKHC